MPFKLLCNRVVYFMDFCFICILYEPIGIDALLGQLLSTGLKWYKVHEFKCYWIAKLVGGFTGA